MSPFKLSMRENQSSSGGGGGGFNWAVFFFPPLTRMSQQARFFASRQLAAMAPETVKKAIPARRA